MILIQYNKRLKPFQTLFQEQPDNAFKMIADIVLDKSFEEKVSEERSNMRKR